MERELWAILQIGIRQLNRSRPNNRYQTYPIATIIRVYLWAALHDRPISWACDPRAWDDRTRPQKLPHQSTMSRRFYQPDFGEFLDALGRWMGNSGPDEMQLVKQIDGKPMYVSRHTQDQDASWGRGAGLSHRGYKLHAIWAQGPMPIAFTVRGLGDDEKIVARKLIPQLTGTGYLLGDAFYDSNPLHDLADKARHLLVAPRKRSHRGGGIGARRHAPGRLRSIALTEPTPHTNQSFSQVLRNARRAIETRFGNLTSFYAGLKQLPAWIRGLPRVTKWVHAKLIINAARIKNILA